MALSAQIKRMSGQYDESVVQRVSLERQGLVDLKGLLNCKSLVDLSVSQNEIANLGGVEGLSVDLRRLDLSFNKLQRIDALESAPFLSSLVFLDLRGNKIENIGEVHILITLTALRTLYFRGPDGEDANPCCSHASYPEVIFQTLPSLQVLDGSHVQLLTATAHLERQMASIAADPAVCSSLEPESWIDAAEMEAAISADQPPSSSSAQMTVALQKMSASTEAIEGQLGQECVHLLSRASGLVQKAVL